MYLILSFKRKHLFFLEGKIRVKADRRVYNLYSFILTRRKIQPGFMMCFLKAPILRLDFEY